MNPVVAAGNLLLDYVVSQGNSVGTPQDACRADWRPDVALLEWMEKRAPALRSRILLHHFFAWYIETHRSRHYDDGRSVQLPNVVNPLPLLQMEPPASETQRRALPSYRIRQLLDLLMKDDWAWPKTLEAEYVNVVDAATGAVRPEWSPVRSSALALMLLLPLRGFQVRALDSGEGDSEVYEDGVWKENTGPLAPVKGTRRKGFLRRYQSSAREWVGFYANTNKTSKLGGTWDKGYELPFEHALVQKIATDLLAWQKTFNPVAGPTSWSGFYGTMVRAIRRAPAFFLFRDPANPDPSVPPTYGCLKWLWDKLMIELETRLATKERNADGSRIELTRMVGRYQCSSYNLHSLRVSHLTQLLTQGKVPLHILSRHVAGHSSVLMTLHYVKTDPLEVAEAVGAAHMEVASQQQEAFTRSLAQDDLDERLFVSNDAAGIAALAQKDVGLWKHMGTGLCPVGGTRCGDGGPPLDKKRFAPVPGGALNCPSCRFHVTGPAFLMGLVVRFNATSMNYDWARDELAAAEKAVREMEDIQYDQEKAGLPSSGSDLSRSRSRYEAALVRVENAVRDLNTLWELVERTKAVARSKTDGVSLVLAGSVADMEAAVRESTQLELWDAVCKGAQFYEGPELRQAVLLRNQALDRALVRANAAPVFYALDPEDALLAGNYFLRLVAAQKKHDEVLQVIDGRVSDVSPDVAALLQENAENCVQTLPQLRNPSR